MTAQFSEQGVPLTFLTLDDWAALPEDELGRSELQEGVLLMSPRPKRRHQRLARSLSRIVEDQLPAGLELLQAIDVIVEASELPTVRIPDFIVVPVDCDEPISAVDVVIAVEVVSPGSRSLDYVLKRHEYAKAGIPHYWIINDDCSLDELRLVGSKYVEATHAVGRFSTDAPFPVEIDLSSL